MTGLMTLMALVFLFVVTLLVFREVYCWYTKQNELIQVQREILEQLKTMNLYFDSLGD